MPAAADLASWSTTRWDLGGAAHPQRFHCTRLESTTGSLGNQSLSIHRDRPRLGVETRKVESNKLNLPKNFKNMG